MSDYAFSEIMDMLSILGEYQQNYKIVAQLYQDICNDTIVDVVAPYKEAVLAIVFLNPYISIRQLIIL